MTPTFRFAPSPNGELHLGHALSAIVGFEMSRRMGGRFLVRIEDIDTLRCRDELVAGIFEDLAWLGITWTEPVLRQSRHLADYVTAATRLDAMELLYPCFATRSEIAAASSDRPEAVDPDGARLYPGLHKALSADEIAARKARGEPFALRLHMDRAMAAMRERMQGAPLTFLEQDEQGRLSVVEAHPERWGDCVIVRKDAPSSYLLAATYDDARQGVTHITRGRDLFAATDVQRLLQTLLGLPQPVYHHHRLVLDGTGRKLSKSAGDTSLKSLREGGVTPSRIRSMLGLDRPAGLPSI